MIAPAELVADLRQTVAGQFLGQRHRHLARPGDGPAALRRQHVHHADAVVFGHRLLDVLDGDLLFLQRQQITQTVAGEVDGDRTAGKAGIGDDPSQRAFELADIGADALGDEERHLLWQLDTALFGLVVENRDPRLQLRRLDGDGQPPAEAGLEPLLETVHLLRVAVGGHDHLLLVLQQGVEGMEEFLLRAILAGKELDVVDQQRIERAIVPLELVDHVVLQRLDHVGDEALGMEIDDAGVAVVREDLIADGMHQVGLAESDAAIDEHRVVGLARLLGDLQRRGPRQLVGLALNEVVEGEVAVEVVGELGRCGRRTRPRAAEADIHLLGCRRSRRGRRRNRLRADDDGDAVTRVSGQLDRQLPDFIDVVFLDPLQNETVGRQQQEFSFAVDRLQWPDPGVDLLFAELRFKTRGTLLPKLVHFGRQGRTAFLVGGRQMINYPESLVNEPPLPGGGRKAAAFATACPCRRGD